MENNNGQNTVQKKKPSPEKRGRSNPVVNKGLKAVNGNKQANNKSQNNLQQKAVVGTTVKQPNANKSTKRTNYRYNNKNKQKPQIPLHIIPLGGLNEIGKNMTLYECQGDMFLVDCGLAFPDADLLGVDIVIPDFEYVEKNIDKIKGLVITHGHEDHIGAIPYLFKKVNMPIYASPLAIGLIRGKLKEHGLLNESLLNVVTPGAKVKFGCMEVEFIHVNHSIPDAMALAIKTPAGTVIQTGDFKIDYTPIDGGVTDIARLAELGSQGVLCLLADSTNAERPGSTASERIVGTSFAELFNNAGGKRIIIASFSSNIHRIQQIITIASKIGRKVAVSGRSMENVVQVAVELGYLEVPKNVLINIDDCNKYRQDEIILVTTGSQGEPMSALSRMSTGDHKKVNVSATDFIIISATPIPGNEKHVTKVVNDLLKTGAEVVYEGMYDVHVSGHACQDELKIMQAITKPKFFIPVHGEYKHLKAHQRVAESMGIPKENTLLSDNGQIIELTKSSMKVVGTAPAGRILVDGLGVGDVGAIVLRDRQHLAQDGLIIIVMTMDAATGALLAGPDIVSRGFVYVRESEPLINEAKQVVKNVIDTCTSTGIRDWATIKLNVRDGLSNYIFKKTKRDPMILPIITEV